MKRYTTYNTYLLGGLLALMGCSKKPTDYRDFLNGEELTYPGKISNSQARPGNGRIQLIWTPSPDQSITQYRVFWNNGADSLTVAANTHNTSDTVRCTIPDLSEYVYSFMLYSYDGKGNRSVSTEISNARVYGTVYIGTLNNRLTNTENLFTVNENNSVTLRFLTPDTINIRTILKYTNAQNQEAVATLAPADNELTLTDYKFGTPILYQSSYIPVANALDTFNVPRYDTIAPIYKLIQCDKSLFQERDMWGDMGIYQSDTRVSRLWDGSVGPQGYPNIFHSDGNGGMPRTLSFDMGKVYNRLAVIEETGRDCCNNPDQFEVWGIADLTNAIPEMNPGEPGWKDAMLNKGWTLLTEVKRQDNGNGAFKANLIDNPPPVRFIRIRVLHNANGENSYVNMSEITFWNKE